tara:strand:+ start:556 stop:813 length:258 start_codon:yes stop_codon:yes gene_type:complete
MITPIPHNGWTDEDIGLQVKLMMPHGTAFTDIIIAIPHEGHILIGPSTEIGMLIARIGMVIPVVQAQDDFIMRYDNDEDQEGDEQ